MCHHHLKSIGLEDLVGYPCLELQLLKGKFLPGLSIQVIYVRSLPSLSNGQGRRPATTFLSSVKKLVIIDYMVKT